MKRYLVAAAMLLSAALPGKAEVINVGVNPTSATGHFSNDVGGGAFTDQITFQLVGGPLFLSFASATNDFLTSADFITNFAAQLFLQVGAIGGGDDTPVSGLVNAVACPTSPAGCQILAGSAILNPGNYYLNITGIGGGTAGYGGNLTTFAVPGPMVGAGIPGLIVMCAGLVALARRRRQQAAV